MPSVNIPLSVSDEVKQVHLADYDKNVFTVKTKFVPNGFQTEIGDIYDVDFKPQIKIKRWDNDANLSVRLASLPDGDEVVFTSSDKIRYKKGSAEARFYYIAGADADSHRHEMDVILYEKPATNTISFTISTKNLVFYKQPALTQEEIDDGASRSDEVVGSYAVFHKLKVNSVWLEKKAMHIYRPLITDATGRTTWGELEILPEQDGQFGTMKITIDQSWLNTAIYPVVVDPTFGYTTAGGSTQNNRKDTLVGNIFTCPQNGKMYRMAAYLGGAAVGRQAQAGCYYSNSALFGYVINGVDIVNGWNFFTEGTGPAAPDFALTANSNYYLVVNNNSASITLYYDSLAIPSYDANQTYNTWQDPETFTARATRTYSIYASYTITNTYSATLSLSANLAIKVNKLLANGNVQLSAQYPGKRVEGISSAAIFSLASAEKTSKRTKSVTATLAADVKKRRRVIAAATLSLVADVSKRINKFLTMATVTLSALEAKRWEGEAAVSTSVSSAVKKKPSKTRDVSILLSSAFDISKTVARTLSAAISLSADIYKLISKILSSPIYLSSDEDRLNKQSFSAALSLQATRVLSVSKLNQAFIYIATYMNEAVNGIVDVTLNLATTVYKAITMSRDAATTISADIYKFISKQFSAVLSLTSAKRSIEGELGDATVSFNASETAFIKKVLRSYLIMEGDALVLTDKESEYSTHFHIYPSIFFSIRKVLEANVQLSSSETASQEAMANVQTSLSGSLAIFVNKVIQAFVSLSSDEYNDVDGAVDVTITITGDQSKAIYKEINESLAVSGSESFLTAKTLSAGVVFSSEENKDVEGSASSDITVSASIAKSISKTLSATLSLTAAREETEGELLEASTSLLVDVSVLVKKTFSVPVQLSSTEEGEVIKEETLLSSLSVEAVRAKKDIGKNITIYPGDGGGLLLILEIGRRIMKTIGVSLDMAAASDAQYDISETLASTISLAAEKRIVVRKTSGVTITVGGEKPGREIAAVAEVTINLSGSSDEEKRLQAGVTIIFEEDMSKFIGKTFTIREHTPSVWHNC